MHNPSTSILYYSLKSSNTPLISLSVPFKLEEKNRITPSCLSSPHVTTHLSTVFTGSTPEGVASLRWALEQGRPVDIDIQAPISDAVLESFEDIIQKATDGLDKVPSIVLCQFFGIQLLLVTDFTLQPMCFRHPTTWNYRS